MDELRERKMVDKFEDRIEAIEHTLKAIRFELDSIHLIGKKRAKRIKYLRNRVTDLEIWQDEHEDKGSDEIKEFTYNSVVKCLEEMEKRLKTIDNTYKIEINALHNRCDKYADKLRDMELHSLFPRMGNFVYTWDLSTKDKKDAK